MGQKSSERLLRWDDVHTESQRKLLLEQTLIAMKALLDSPERLEIIGDYKITDDWDGNLAIINKSGFADIRVRYYDKLDILWIQFKILIGYPVDEIPESEGRQKAYTYHATDDELSQFAQRWKLSASDFYKVGQALKA